MTPVQEVKDKLRPYQLEGIDIMEPRNRWLECDDMGLGKTVTCLTSFLSKVDLAGQRVLITCSTNAMGVWKEELMKWFNLPSIIYTGTPAQRKKIWAQFEAQPEVHFLITTYAMLKELPLGWLAVFGDEYHQSGLINSKSEKALLFQKHLPYFKHVYLITGTPIRQGVTDLFFPLHLMDPDAFPNYWAFVNKYCIVIQTPFGKQIERNPKNIPEFRQMLNKYMIRRLKTEVLKDLPGKQRTPVPVVMSAKQSAVYKALLEEFMYEGNADEDIILSPNQMVTDLRLRQLLVTPRLLGIDDDGAGFAYLSEVVPDLLLANRPVVIFTPFRQAIPLIADLVKGWKLNTTIYTLQGGMTPAAFADQWQAFQKLPSKNKVLLCVIKSGASFHATESADCYFLGYEWDFNLNVQSEDRLCRLGQHNAVQCNYLLHEGDTVDDDVKNKLNEKQLSADWIIGSEKQYKELLRKVRQPQHG
ncbi:MAG: DEAD/DEAH box helicase [Tannerellaceae bacterium]